MVLCHALYTAAQPVLWGVPCGACSTPLNTAWHCPPPGLLRRLLKLPSLQLLHHFQPLPRAGERAAMAHIFCLVSWQLPCQHAGSLEEQACGGATVMLPPSLGLLSVLLQRWKMHV
jgi:hypothetical protein